jgi:PAS domain S-box-containing protein
MVLTDSQGNIEFFNRMFIRQYGWTTDDVRTPEQWWNAAYPDPEYQRKVQDAWGQAVVEAQQEDRQISPQTWKLTCKNGQQRETEFRMVPVSEQTSVIAMVDLTDRNRAMRTIRFERDRAQSYLDTVDVMILAVDPHGTITQINRAGCALLGYEEEELIGKNWFECCLSPEERERLMNSVHATAMEQDEGHTSYIENEVITRGGEKHLIAWRNAQLTDDEGRVVGSLSAGADITEIRRAEREREKLFEQLQHTQKAEAIGQLSAGVSHNFNNMFASIIGFLGLAKRKADSDGDEDMKRYLEEALSSSHRARDLVAQIASFSRKSSVDIQPAVLSEVLIRSVELLNNILPSAVVIRVDCDPRFPQVLLDEEQFQQVLANLLNNASDAMSGEGTINIACDLVNVTEQRCHSCHEEFQGDFVVVEIHDNGHGMSPEVLSRIFDPFFTTREVGQGTGMGLAVVHGIIHHFDGHIQVESREGEGAIVTLYLALASSN